MNGKRRIIGFTQGRFSPLVNGKIQAFPWDSWSEEFSVAYENDFNIIEWTLDQDRLYENPFMKDAGQREIKTLSNKFDISILLISLFVSLLTNYPTFFGPVLFEKQG